MDMLALVGGAFNAFCWVGIILACTKVSGASDPEALTFMIVIGLGIVADIIVVMFPQFGRPHAGLIMIGHTAFLIFLWRRWNLVLARGAVEHA